MVGGALGLMRSLAELLGWRRRGGPKVAAGGRASQRRLLRRRKKRALTREEEWEVPQQAQQAPKSQHVPLVQQAPPVEQAPLVQRAPQSQQEQPQQRGAKPEGQRGSRGGSFSCVWGAPPLPSCSDLEDEVFEDEEPSALAPQGRLPPPQHPPYGNHPHGHHAHDHHAHDHHTYVHHTHGHNTHDLHAHEHHAHDPHPHGHYTSSGGLPVRRRPSKTQPAAKLQMPTILVEGQRLQEGSLGHVRHSSDPYLASCLTHSAPPSPQPPPRVPEVTLDELGAGAASSRPPNPWVPMRKAAFTVKYTKVYGETDGAYNNDSRPRGLVFMCNFKYFAYNRHSPRVGSERDFENLLSLFSQMGYNPEHRRRRYCLTDRVSRAEFLQRLQEFAAEAKHKAMGSCVVVLMSHGSGPRTFVASDNLPVDLLDVYKIFDNINCPNLKGKPKIFILQFCRGEEPTATARQGAQAPASPGGQARRQVNDELLERMVKRQVSIILRDYLKDRPALLSPEVGGVGMTLEHIKEHSRQASLASLASIVQEVEGNESGDSAGATDGESCGGDGSRRYEADTSVIAALPAAGLQRYSDMYSIFSTSPGELSQRHPSKGSLLIQAICHVFAEYAYQDDIDTLVRRVSTYMTKTLQRDDPVTVPRQTCERTNNGLDKLFYFNPYEMAQHRQLTI